MRALCRIPLPHGPSHGLHSPHPGSPAVQYIGAYLQTDNTCIGAALSITIKEDEGQDRKNVAVRVLIQLILPVLAEVLTLPLICLVAIVGELFY